MGISPAKFKKHKNLDNFYKIVSWSPDRKGKKFVSTIEGRYYPFYGVQWHPERSAEMDIFAQFFKSELKKNNRKLHKTRRSLLRKDIDCFHYSNSLYKKCRFYWFITSIFFSANPKYLPNTSTINAIILTIFQKCI